MVGTLEQHVADMRRKDIMDQMTDADRRLLGRAGRIEIPWTDAYTLRRIAGLLRGFCATLDTASRRTDLSERAVLLDIKAEVQNINLRIRELHGIEKFNKNGSTRNGDKS